MTSHKSRPRLWTVFHLNLMFSSIEESLRAEVIERCYRPLLAMVRDLQIPVGIELSGFTLEEIHRLAPDWIAALRALIDSGLCELIGSGYAQIAGPLVPQAVNVANQVQGMQCYTEHLGQRPTIALVNEQAFSIGLVPAYAEAGYTGLILDWENTVAQHPDWPLDIGRRPRTLTGTDLPPMAVLWSRSIAFQKVQRYIHGEIELDELMTWVDEHALGPGDVFPLYTNDAEVFGYRPGRFQTEAPVVGDEWKRWRDLFQALRNQGRYALTGPSGALVEVLAEPTVPIAPLADLTSAATPVTVKKQWKYTLLRWSVAGRNSAVINAACHRAARAMSDTPPEDRSWRPLLHAWSSDFRTHITQRRWDAYCAALPSLAPDLMDPDPIDLPSSATDAADSDGCAKTERVIVLRATTGERVDVNPRRGLAIQAVRPGSLDKTVCGSIPHGWYTDIQLAADWYTGHVVLEPPGTAKIADLNPARLLRRTSTLLEGEIPTQLGPVRKRITLHGGGIVLRTELHWPEIPAGSLRLGHVTLWPEAFDPDTLAYATTNGGSAEFFDASKGAIDHTQPVSASVSARSAIGVTDGWLAIGDSSHHLLLTFDPGLCATPVAMIKVLRPGRQWFGRVAFSLQEVDDTLKAPRQHDAPLVFCLRLDWRPGPPGAPKDRDSNV